MQPRAIAPSANRENRSAPSEEERILEALHAAVMEQRLPPGTRLPEAALTALFGVGRMRIRRVLLRLAEQGAVVLEPNRGALVARPSREEARAVFEARRAIESFAVRQAALGGDRAALAGLSAVLRAERAARRRGDRREAIALSGAFHLRIIELAGNPLLRQFAAELVMRTSLIIALYGSAADARCAEEEHRALLAAIRAKAPAEAARQLEAHLSGLEAGLNFEALPPPLSDIRGLLPATARSARAGGKAPGPGASGRGSAPRNPRSPRPHGAV